MLRSSLELRVMRGKRYGSNSILLHVAKQFNQQHLLMSVFICCQKNLPVAESGVWKTSTTVVLELICDFTSDEIFVLWNWLCLCSGHKASQLECSLCRLLSQLAWVTLCQVLERWHLLVSWARRLEMSFSISSPYGRICLLWWGTCLGGSKKKGSCFLAQFPSLCLYRGIEIINI